MHHETETTGHALQASLKTMEGKYDDTAKFLTACLNDVKRKIVTITRADVDALDEQVQVKSMLTSSRRLSAIE